MPTTPHPPGVYVEEIPTLPPTIPPAPTATAAFIGRVAADSPFRVASCQRPQDLPAAFPQADAGFAIQVSLFFINGGSHCHVVNLPGAEPTHDVRQDYRLAMQALTAGSDGFNLLVLPQLDQIAGPAAPAIRREASEFCRRQRAVLLLDAPAQWNSLTTMLDADTGVEALRTQVVADHAALFDPRLRVGATDGVGPSGAIAGLLARIDGSRGVWKAPAGVEATLKGVDGLAHRWTDAEGRDLNAQGINLLRVLPAGIVNFGARTLAGADALASEYKYLPVRRTALFIESSLRQGLAWAAFEPNDEPLWARLRLAAGSFLHGLFRQGAFQGSSPREAFFVHCDATTTSAADRAQARLNLQVGFAPLKPAEFVVLSLALASDLQWVAPQDGATPTPAPIDDPRSAGLLVAADPRARLQAARIVARESGAALYRVDLAAVTGKYIGETGKNLDRMFAAAESAGAVLLFDEADALFGKRSTIRDAHDRYANIEINALAAPAGRRTRRRFPLLGLRRPPEED